MTLAGAERGRLRELRHDFRRYYGVRYDDVEADEAIDLIETLPRGSAYVRAVRPDLSWSEVREAVADLQDTLWEIAYARAGSREEPYRVTRPADVVARAAARDKARATRRRIEGGEWAALDG